MAEIYLFTWNLGPKPAARNEAHGFAVDHLAMMGARLPFIACLQELPAASWVARGRRRPQSELASRDLAVVSTLTLPRGLALIHSTSLRVVGTPVADEDEEFVAACFQQTADPRKTIMVVGVHAKSKVDMPHPQDHGGVRALLRHAIHQLGPLGVTYHHQVVLGDFNSSHLSREMQSWHGFYALSSNRPPGGAGAARRRGFQHAPLRVVRPANERVGTCALADPGGEETPVVDFVAVDEATHPGARSAICTHVAGKPVWDALGQRPSLSDHLPVEAYVTI